MSHQDVLVSKLFGADSALPAFGVLTVLNFVLNHVGKGAFVFQIAFVNASNVIGKFDQGVSGQHSIHLFVGKTHVKGTIGKLDGV